MQIIRLSPFDKNRRFFDEVNFSAMFMLSKGLYMDEIKSSFRKLSLRQVKEEVKLLQQQKYERLTFVHL